MVLEEASSFRGESPDHHWEAEALAISDARAKRNLLVQARRDITDSKFQVRDSILVAKKPALNPSVKWRTLIS